MLKVVRKLLLVWPMAASELMLKMVLPLVTRTWLVKVLAPWRMSVPLTSLSPYAVPPLTVPLKVKGFMQ